MDDPEFFLRTLDDLRARGASTDRYELVKSSGLLRLLLLDGLIDRANRQARLKLAFELLGDGSPIPNPPRLRIEVHWQNVDPAQAHPGAPRRRVSRDELLATPILTLRGEPISVRDLISTAANSMGGVHRGEPRDDQQRRVIDLDVLLRAGPLPAQMSGVLAFVGISAPVPDAVAALHGLIAVVVRGLQPLEEAIRASGPCA